jgi:hypothetical protein
MVLQSHNPQCAAGREQTDLRRVTKLLEDAAERFMCEAVFAERSRKVHHHC